MLESRFDNNHSIKPKVIILKFLPLRKGIPIKLALLLIICTVKITAKAQVLTIKHKQQKIINPTGIYILKGQQKGDETYGYFGHVYVQSLTKQKIVVKFYICKGCMSYASGSFIDTLVYQNNVAIYGPSENDATCKITFTFYPNHVVVNEQTANYNSGCDFGHGVVANATFRKQSNRKPTNKEMTAD